MEGALIDVAGLVRETQGVGVELMGAPSGLGTKGLPSAMKKNSLGINKRFRTFSQTTTTPNNDKKKKHRIE